MSDGTLLLLDVSGWIAPTLLAKDVQGGPANADGVLVAGPNRFFAKIFDLLRMLSPDYFIVACDSPKESLVRTRLYPPYKSNRPEKTEMFSMQIKLIYKIMNELNFPLQRVPEWEADDVIASYVHNYAGVMGMTTIASDDKDLHQMLDIDRVRIIRRDGMFYHRKDAEAKWKVPVKKIRHVQALAGDSADKIPGAQGIGPAKAAALIEKYGTAKRVKAAAEELTSGAKIAIRAFDPDLNLKLVTLERTLPIPEELPPWTTPSPKFARQVLTTYGLSAST